MALEAYGLCRPYLSAVRTAATPLQAYYTGSAIEFNFPYEGFQWLPLLPPWGIHVVVGLLAFSGLTMALGFCYRASVVVVFLTWGYLFAVESTRTYWQSHFYLELLLAFLLIWMPAARTYSVDAWLARRQNLPRTVPYWTVWLLRGQLVIGYFYAGLAKVNLDWLLDAVPVRWYLQRAHVTAPYEPYLTTAQLETFTRFLHSTVFAYFISYTGLAFDLTIGFVLLIPRTRAFGLILMVLFHATNHLLIFDDIGFFPLVGILTALIFLNPDWPERCWRWLRRPRLVKPDWGWSVAGGIVFPMVGAALGWKARTSAPPSDAKASFQLGGCTVPFVIVWMVWQALLPLRHYLIPGDARMTYEGLSFSWRLKTEVHSARYVQISIQDPMIVSAGDTNRIRINWNEWHGEKVIYRTIAPGRINWPALPEIVVLLEPLVGERVLYNPYAASTGVRTETEARERVNVIWQQSYGRSPAEVRRTLPLSHVLDSISAALRIGGGTQEAASLAALASRTKQIERDQSDPQEAMNTRNEVLTILTALQARDQHGEMTPFLRPMDPFTLEGERHSAAPFLLIEDPMLFEKSPGQQAFKVARALFKHGEHTRGKRNGSDVDLGGEPLVIYTGNVGKTGIQPWSLLPQACIFESGEIPDQLPHIYWNSLKDLPISKMVHISNQAFYLRRYARRVADLWETEYGRRPVVNALTAVSLNGRPYQFLVDPDTDLASVSVKWFGHNEWVKDLETPRIPPDAIAKGKALMGR